MTIPALAEELASIDDPFTHSTEGLDDGCFFCGAWARSHYNDTSQEFDHWAEHRSRCLWIRARAAFGLPLGLHKVSGEEV